MGGLHGCHGDHPGVVENGRSVLNLHSRGLQLATEITDSVGAYEVRDRSEAYCEAQQGIEQVLAVVQGDDEQRTRGEDLPDLAQTATEVGRIPEVVQGGGGYDQIEAPVGKGEVANVGHHAGAPIRTDAPTRSRHHGEGRVDAHHLPVGVRQVGQDRIRPHRLLEEIRLQEAAARASAPSPDERQVHSPLEIAQELVEIVTAVLQAFGELVPIPRMGGIAALPQELLPNRGVS
jgi:hypothetical protein